ncbi:MAG: hypothetical protein FJX68_05240 [Alphaproteobacteria bacterium]|nr:hypothetical protein [Alphaproteobacteria bacterium]
MSVNHDDAPWPVREDLQAAHARAWRRLARAGTWFSGAERVAIAAEARQAQNCRLCRERSAALTPGAVPGRHDSLGALPLPQVEAVHRIVSDPGRLSRAWREGLRGQGLSDEQYVELIGVVATVTAVDTFRLALGLAPWPLPVPVSGAPSGYRPTGLDAGRAWVPMIHPKTVQPAEADLYAGSTGAYVRQALSLVPDEVRGFFDLVETQYLPAAAMRDYAREPRAISHAQIELIAGRVSALNQCVY